MSSENEDAEVEVSVVDVEVEDEGEVLATASVEPEDDDNATVKSDMSTNDSTAPGTPSSTTKSSGGSSKKRRRSGPPPGSRKGRSPAVPDLTIPFRAIKRTMKLDGDIATVQNEAAIVMTLAAEMFIKRLAKESHNKAKTKGRNTIRYEDVAEARTKTPALSFLETLIP